MMWITDCPLSHPHIAVLLCFFFNAFCVLARELVQSQFVTFALFLITYKEIPAFLVETFVGARTVDKFAVRECVFK